MPMLKLALIAGACGCLGVSYASWVAGYPPELAVTRGVAGFMAFSLLGFIAELITVEGTPRTPVEPEHAAEPEAPATGPQVTES